MSLGLGHDLEEELKRLRDEVLQSPLVSPVREDRLQIKEFVPKKYVDRDRNPPPNLRECRLSYPSRSRRPSEPPVLRLPPTARTVAASLVNISTPTNNHSV